MSPASAAIRGPVREWPVDRLHHGFEAIVDRQPDAPAVLFPDAPLTYAALDAQANAIAHALLESGVRDEEPVGVLVGRSGHLPAAFLGILKAGATYVPMMADLPDDRLADMARQAGMRRLIALDRLSPPDALSAVLAGHDGPDSAVLRPEDLSDAFQQAHAHRPHRSGPGSAIGTILFTSGSTGRPKGVMLRHDAMVGMAHGHVEAQGLTADDRLLLSAAPGFILGFREICLPLAAGCAYVPITRAQLDAPDTVLEIMARHRVTVALFTPSYLRLFQGRVPDGLRCLLTAGERPNADDARHYASHLDYWNIHGATEVCGTICMYPVDPTRDGPLPSGRPFANLTVFLLDRDGREVAPGETGIIHAAGPALAAGYLGQPELTARTFVDTPYGRAYCTNDLGRWTANGDLETIGRADDVVKVSGQTVSLGEIERALLRHPDARRAAVLQHNGRLIGFVESDNKTADWAAPLAERLPAYMVPAQIHAVPRLPINASGKLDRKSMAAQADQLLSRRQGTPPQGPVEKQVAALWEEILNVRPILREDTFFAVGGTSLRAITVAQRLQAAGYAATPQTVLLAGTVAALAAKLAASAAEAAAPPEPPLPDRDRATSGQEEFWVAAQIGTVPAGAQVSRCLRVTGPPRDTASWQAAWTALVARHPALRTGFETDADDQLFWRVTPPDALPPDAALEIAACPDRAAADALVRARLDAPFDLTAPSLARAGLITVAEDGDTLFWFSISHAVVDGLSARLVQEDMLALLLDQPRPPVPNGVALASRAERMVRGAPSEDTDLAWWETTLDQSPDTVFEGLPLDHPRPASPTGRAAPPLRRRLSAATMAPLEALAREHAVGLHALLLALLAAEAGRRVGRDTVVIGTGVSNRPPGAEAALGHFVNVLPLPVRQGLPLAKALPETQAALAGALAHGTVPAAEITRRFRQRRPEARPAERTALIDLSLTGVPSRFCHDPDSGLTLEPANLPGETGYPAAGFDLAFSYEPVGDALDLTLLWNPDVYDRATAEAWLDALADWAAWVAADVDRAAHPLPPLLPREETLLDSWEHGPARDWASVHGATLAEARTDQAPDAPIVVTAGATLSRAALDAQANAVAWALIERGVTSGDTVAVLAQTTAALPAVVLGLWKAGAVYLPLAADLPAERLAFMAGDADAHWLVLPEDKPVPETLAGLGPPVRAATLAPRSDRPPRTGTAADPAYTIYTSGTTGRPKGVTLPHGGMINSVLTSGTVTGLEPADRMALVATPGFDASLWELGLGLFHGLALVPIPPALRDDPWALKRHYADQGVTAAFHAPSYLRVSQEEPFDTLRVLFSGGEAATPEDVRAVTATGCAFWHAYGPTEASIIASLEQIPPDVTPGRALSVGGPLPNTSISLRRDDGSRVPPGALGEVWLFGLGVGAGYIGRPEETARSFVDTPDGPAYRTGDLGRWTPEGRLLLAGRRDQQVKLHGQRLELDEIRQALRALPGVADAAVVVDEGTLDTKLLRGFVRMARGRPPADWQARLGDHLPLYMVPASLTAVEVLPVRPSGKLDHEALLTEARRQEEARDTAAPRNALERQIAAVWEDLLGATVHREDNFFALGGNSLLAVTAAHRLSQALERTVPARDIFTAPTLAAFAERCRRQAAATPTPQPAPDADSDLATEAEREFWVAEQAGLDHGAFIMPLQRLIRTDPMPGLDDWQRAWAGLVARHDALRTSFAEDANGRLRRRLHSHLTDTLSLSSEQDLPSALAHIRGRQAVPFRLDTPPLWRAGLIRVRATGEHLFWIAQHHAIGDGRSLGLMLEDLSALLRGDTLPEQSAAFADSARREAAYLQGPEAATDAAHWQKTLTRLPDAAFEDWPLDRPRPADPTRNTQHRFQARLSPETTVALKALARDHAASLHAVIIALLATEAARRAARDAILIGTPADMRETAAEASIVGCFVNMLPVALHAAGAGASFGAVVAETQQALAEALQHGRYPFARIYQDLRTERGLNRHPARYPLFDLAVVETPEVRQPDTALRFETPSAGPDDVLYEQREVSPGQDMILMHEGLGDGSLLLQWNVNAAIYARETAEAWFLGIRSRADWLAADGRHAAAPLPALLPREAALLADWQSGGTVPRAADRFPALVEAMVDRLGPAAARTPAILTRTTALSYAALEDQANALAQALIGRGLRPGAVVGVVTRRAPALPATALGIWKAGGVYLPLAADLPTERLRGMAADAGAACIVALDGAVVPEGLGLDILRPETLPAGKARRPTVPGSAEDTAYILYTSGSTGRPKGTRVSHRAYVNTVLGTGVAVGITEDDRCLMAASPSFDVSLTDFGVPLAFGATVCPLSDEDQTAPRRFVEFLETLRITVADITPTYLRLLDGADLPSLRVLITGGEAPLPQDVRRYAGRLRYLNAYGPTENAITSTLGPLAPDDDGPHDCGRPLPNTSVHICHPDGTPVPPGMTGEVWLGGAGLADGYVGRPKQTAAAFIDTAEGRRYRTGDLGRWRVGPGAAPLQILGRADDQVKLNGIRIELGEIESILADHPAVAQAAVLADTDAHGKTSRLRAAVTLRTDAPAPPATAWRPYLQDRLPAAMVPATVETVDTLPVTASGKVDKAALAARLSDAPAPARQAMPPRTPTERQVAALWSELLGVTEIRRDDNFFMLGGHSVLAIAVAHRLEDLLDRGVSARLLFATPVLSDFARRLDEADGPAAAPAAASDRATEGQREFWVAEQAGMDTRGFTLTLALTPSDGPLEAERWDAAWATLVDRHPALRTAFAETADGVLRRQVSPTLDEALEHASRADGPAVQAYIRARQAEPFAMGEAPLWRAGVVTAEDDGRQAFWLAMHHAIGDGVSLGVVVEDLTLALRGAPLSPLAAGVDMAAGDEEAWLASPAAQAAADHWRDALDSLERAAPADANPFDDWPLDTPRPLSRADDRRTGCHVFRQALDAETTAALRRFAHAQGASLHALMLTLVGLEVRRRTGRPGFVLGTAASTRETSAQARTVGYFVNMLPVPCALGDSPTVEAALARMQRTLGDGLVHHRYPFARIYQDHRARSERPTHPTRHPLFDIAVSENPAVTADGEGGPRLLPLAAPLDDGLQYDLRAHGPAQDMVLIHEGLSDGRLALSWLVNADLYEQHTAQHWIQALAGWARFLAHADRQPDTVLPALQPEEAALLARWEHGPTLEAIPFPARFTHLAATQPDRPALVTEDGTVSYRTMERRTNALARHLRDQGIGPGVAVGVITERSTALPETVLAIWKAGGCYVPLVRDLPEARLGFIARDAAVRLLVVLDGAPLPTALAEADLPVMRPETLPGEAAAGPDTGRAAEDPAYIIYTSGSTGQPKGVVLSVGGIDNLCAGLMHSLEPRETDRALLMASPSFDAWISDLLIAWTSGGATVPVLRAELDDPAGLRAKLERLGVTIATLPPSYLRLFEQAPLPSLRQLMTVGERPQTADALHYAAQLTYINGYGPSENTIATSLGRIYPWSTHMTVGRPLPNVRVRILNDRHQPVPPGAIGRLWLSGAGLALGYLNRPDLTAERFVDLGDGRAYDCGDLGRWAVDGDLEILGRADTQVKLRGQRVELDEVEHVMSADEAVIQAVAAVQTRTDGSQTLWGFVTLAEGAPVPAPEDWQARLSRKLPAYSIPAAVLAVPSIPVTLAGKVDREALIRTHCTAGPSLPGTDHRSPPHGPTEERIAALWQERLGCGAVSREDTFFDLGGDSLRAIAVVNALRQDYDCSINDLYDHPTLAGFARCCQPRREHLRALLVSAADDWRTFQDGRAAFEAARTDTLAAPLAAYATRNRRYDALDLSHRPYGHVLLTGATGYVGSYLLRALLAEGDRRVTVLVRDADAEMARKRLGDGLTHYFGATAARALCDTPRLTVRAGDLRRDDLGLGTADRAGLAAVDAIIHAAANVNHYGPYATFQEDNVRATERLLRLAAERPAPADVHLVSTLSVAGRPPEDGFRLFCEDDAVTEATAENYYVRTKQEAERLAVAARDHLPNVCVHRVGNVVFPSDASVLQRNIQDNAFTRHVGALLHLGAVPEEAHVFLCHVDMVARGLLLLAETPALANLTHHLDHPRQDDLAALLAPEATPCDFATFLDHVEAALDDPARRAAAQEVMESMTLYSGRAPQPRGRRLDLVSHRTNALLARLGLTWPDLPEAGRAAMLRAAAALYDDS